MSTEVGAVHENPVYAYSRPRKPTAVSPSFLQKVAGLPNTHLQLCPPTPAQATTILPTVGAAFLRAGLDIIKSRSCSLSTE